MKNCNNNKDKKDLQRDYQRCTTYTVPFTLFKGGGGVTPLSSAKSVGGGGTTLSGAKSGARSGRGTPCSVPGLVWGDYTVPDPVGGGGVLPVWSQVWRGGLPLVHGTDPPCEQTN